MKTGHSEIKSGHYAENDPKTGQYRSKPSSGKMEPLWIFFVHGTLRDRLVYKERRVAERFAARDNRRNRLPVGDVRVARWRPLLCEPNGCVSGALRARPGLCTVQPEITLNFLSVTRFPPGSDTVTVAVCAPEGTVAIM